MAQVDRVVGRQAEPAPTQFAALVRDALLHLYDGTYLQRHALATLVEPSPGAGATTRAKLLLRTLVDAIESLRPAPGTPSDSRAWRSYRILEMRYLEGMSAGEVIDRLTISKTQYQRDHARVLEAVASLLWDAFGRGSALRSVAGEVDDRRSLAMIEADDLARAMNRDVVDLGDMLSGLVSLLRPSFGGRALSLAIQPGLPPVQGDRVVLRQIILGLLHLAFRRSDLESVQVNLERREPGIALVIEAILDQSALPPLCDDERLVPEIDVARRLAAAMGGQLNVPPQAGPSPWRVIFTLPMIRRPTVLVLDNHPDFVNLVSRYLTEDEWDVLGATDVQQAQALIAARRPDLILLDLMMPGQDGWDLLISLNQPSGGPRIPVIVCSVLDEPEMARVLGAASYLPKPVTQDALLKAVTPFRPEVRAMESTR
jgi:CheY-like chemotaxis protein